jgi:putative transposase
MTNKKTLKAMEMTQPNHHLKPVRDFRIYRRNLPHWENPGSVYFLTFHTRTDLILSETARDIVLNSLQFHADKKYRLYAGVVMETHVHSILQPLEQSAEVYYGLAQITHSLKSYSSNRIQRELKISGRIWQEETYDRIVRDDQEYLEKAEYIIYNPVKGGLVAHPEEYKWLYVEGFE